MIAFDWFDAKAAKGFGTELAEAFAKALLAPAAQATFARYGFGQP